MDSYDDLHCINVITSELFVNSKIRSLKNIVYSLMIQGSPKNAKYSIRIKRIKRGQDE